MNHLIDDLERAALLEAARLLPASWRRIGELITEPVPEAPTETVPAPDDDAVQRLTSVDHIVVMMLENGSFDHMLGYLSLPQGQGGRARADVDGLKGPDQDVNHYQGSSHPIHHLDRTQFVGETEAQDHSGASVDEQLRDGGAGFVANFARISAARAAEANMPAPDPGLVMNFQTGFYDPPACCVRQACQADTPKAAN
jgi:hypothetical protein